MEVRFQEQVYTFQENDNEMEVCLTTFDDLKLDFTVCLDISVQAIGSQSATGICIHYCFAHLQCPSFV